MTPQFFGRQLKRILLETLKPLHPRRSQKVPPLPIPPTVMPLFSRDNQEEEDV